MAHHRLRCWKRQNFTGALGYEVLFTSSSTGEGSTGCGRFCAGVFRLFIVKSGVGKTSLLYALQSGLGLRVAEIGVPPVKAGTPPRMWEMFTLDGGGGSLSIRRGARVWFVGCKRR